MSLSQSVPPLLLVVDDDPFYGRLGSLAAGEYFRVRTFTEASAVDAAALIDAEALVLDLDMPGMDGIDLITGPEMAHVPVEQRPWLVLISGMEEPVLALANRVAALTEMRCVAVLRKPFTAEELANVLLGARPKPLRAPITETDVPVTTAERLRRALQEEQIETWLQPQVSLEDGCVVGFEALARWQHPRWGTLTPAFFLEAAESDEMAAEFTHHILRRALLAMQRVDVVTGTRLRLAVNVSAAALATPGFAHELINTLQRFDFAPARLVCELTEHAAARSDQATLGAMARLLMRGISLSIDDFGTGYSNLGQIKGGAISELKLDRTLVQDMMSSRVSKDLTQSIVRSVRHSGLRVVAEGVEDLAALEASAKLGCTEAQGYFLSPAMAPEDAPAWLQQHLRFAEIKPRQVTGRGR